MVVGNGLVASAFAEFRSDDDVVIFASGVSNSKETDPIEFSREISLLNAAIDEHGDKIWAYFSTCSVTDPSLENSAYVIHKQKIEGIIRARLTDYVIFRVSNIVGGTANPNVILNYLVNHISSGEEFHLWEQAARNLLDIEDVVKIVSYVLHKKSFKNEIVNIASPNNTSVVRLVELLEKFIGKKANFVKERFGGSPVIDTSPISKIIEACSIEFGEDYVENLLEKYYKTTG